MVHWNYFMHTDQPLRGFEAQIFIRNHFVLFIWNLFRVGCGFAFGWDRVRRRRQFEWWVFDYRRYYNRNWQWWSSTTASETQIATESYIFHKWTNRQSWKRIWTYSLSGCICTWKTGGKNSITWSSNTGESILKSYSWIY